MRPNPPRSSSNRLWFAILIAVQRAVIADRANLVLLPELVTDQRRLRRIAESLRGLGVSEEKIASIAYWTVADCYNEQERAVLAYEAEQRAHNDPE